VLSETVHVYEWSALSPLLSAVTVLLVTGGLLALAIVGVRRARRRVQLAAEAEASIDANRTLHEGDIVLSGVVEHAPERDVAVRIDVTQFGTESESSGSWSHTWREVDRKVTVAPFYLRLADGTRVRVEAPSDVDVADDLDKKVLISDNRRVLSAELVPGEQLHVRGWLERGGDASASQAGYRDVAWGWLLRGDRGGMLLSSHPLGKGMRERAAFHGWYAKLAIMMLAIFQLTVVTYYARWLGSTELATVRSRDHVYTTDSDGDTHSSYVIDIALRDGAREVLEIDGDDYSLVVQGTIVAIRRGALNWQLGAYPAITFWLALPALGLTLSVWLLYRARRRGTQPWFRQKQVVHSGSGRLPG
jgi:hypothetical protein